MSIHVLTPVQTPLTVIPTAPCRFPDGSTGCRAASLNQLRWKVVKLKRISHSHLLFALFFLYTGFQRNFHHCGK